MEKPPIIAILAGGHARRMGGQDKAELIWEGERMIDRITARLSGQGQIVISGRRDYGLGVPVIADPPQWQGPAAGLAALAGYAKTQGADGFFTVPVDGPNPPPDLVKRLSGEDCAVAVDAAGQLHPTYAYWRREDIFAVLEGLQEENPSLKYLAKLTQARAVKWTLETVFININYPEDLLS